MLAYSQDVIYELETQESSGRKPEFHIAVYKLRKPVRTSSCFSKTVWTIT